MILLGLGLSILTIVGAAYWFLKPTCASNHLDFLASPSGKLKMEVYNRDCGAMDGFSTFIAIIKAEEQTPISSDNAFFWATTDHGAVPDHLAYSEGGPKVKMEWLSENEVQITYPKASKILKSESQDEKIRINYLSE